MSLIGGWVDWGRVCLEGWLCKGGICFLLTCLDILLEHLRESLFVYDNVIGLLWSNKGLGLGCYCLLYFERSVYFLFSNAYFRLLIFDYLCLALSGRLENGELLPSFYKNGSRITFLLYFLLDMYLRV